MPDSDTPLVHVQDIATAFGLLSRLPLPGAAGRGARSAWAWPLVGAAVGAIGAAVAATALALGLSPDLAAAAALAATALATGALHEDGLADTADGLWGGWTPARRLEIMKDSHIGSYGVLALILVSLARWSALAVLLAGGQVLVLIAVGALSRAPMAVVMAALPPARATGLSHGVGRPGAATALLGCLAALTIALLSAGLAMLALAGIGALAALALALVARARIGGQTGDILGAAQVLAETAMLAAATVLLP